MMDEDIRLSVKDGLKVISLLRSIECWPYENEKSRDMINRIAKRIFEQLHQEKEGQTGTETNHLKGNSEKNYSESEGTAVKGKISQRLKDFRKNWIWKIGLDPETEEKILKAVKNIPFGDVEEKDGSRFIAFELGGKEYKYLEVNLKNHSDEKYVEPDKYSRWGINIGVKLSGMFGDDTSKRKNRELAEYVDRERNDRGFEIPAIETQKEVIDKLGEQAGLTKESDKIAMRIYLTGLYGEYWLSMGDKEKSDTKSLSRSTLYENWFNSWKDGSNEYPTQAYDHSAKVLLCKVEKHG